MDSYTVTTWQGYTGPWYADVRIAGDPDCRVVWGSRPEATEADARAAADHWVNGQLAAKV